MMSLASGSNRTRETRDSGQIFLRPDSFASCTAIVTAFKN